MVQSIPIRLRAGWRSFVSRAGGNASLADDGFNIIEKLYGEPGRHYHTLDHIAWCLDLLYEFFPESALGRPPWFYRTELALWFHDIVYDPKRKDNEVRSARALKGFAILAGFPELLADDAAHDILATTHTNTAEDIGSFLLPTQWVLDIDLASLGFLPERFDENSDQIRREYAFVPEDAFVAGRKTVLQGFLGRPRIYLTDECHARFEDQARDNLQRAIAKLTAA